jgi:ribosomal protein L4
LGRSDSFPAKVWAKDSSAVNAREPTAAISEAIEEKEKEIDLIEIDRMKVALGS